MGFKILFLRLFLICRFYRSLIENLFLKNVVLLFMTYLILDLRFRTDQPASRMKPQCVALDLGRRPAKRKALPLRSLAT